MLLSATREGPQMTGKALRERLRRRVNRLMAVAALIVAATAAAHAAGASDPAGDRMLKSYVLSMDKIAKYDAASRAVTAAMKSDPGLKAEDEKMSDEPEGTVAELEAKFTRHPRLFAFYAKQGLSKDDAVLLPLALMGACTLAQTPANASKGDDETTSASQVAFCRKNLAALKKFSFFTGGADDSDQ